MQWVIKILSNRLREEEALAVRHGAIAAADRKYAESARMARERVPQLKQAIELLQGYVPAKPKTVRPTPHQLNIFQ